MKTMLPLRYPSVNWVDGMKISREHFIAQENARIDRFRDTMTFNTGSKGFGLLPPVHDNEPAFRLVIETGELILSHCRAVTSGGLRVEIMPGFAEPLRLQVQETLRRQNLENAAVPLDVILTGDPWGHSPFGEMDPAETPPRQPYTQASLRLEIVPPGQTKLTRHNGFALKLGVLTYSEGAWELDERYIPACARIHAHPALSEHYRKWADDITRLGEYCLQIYARHDRLQLQDLQIDIRRWTLEIMQFMADTQDGFFLLLPDQPPVYFVEYLIRLARNVRVFLRLLPQPEDQMLQYLCKHLYPPGQLTISPSEMSAKLEKPLYCSYDHENLAAVLSELEAYRELLLRIFKKSTELSFRRMEDDERHTIVPPAIASSTPAGAPMEGGFTIQENEEPAVGSNFLGGLFRTRT